jgi:hypothetical protein
MMKDERRWMDQLARELAAVLQGSSNSGRIPAVWWGSAELSPSTKFGAVGTARAVLVSAFFYLFPENGF